MASSAGAAYTSLAGMRAVVTGASRGIGEATARILAAHGASVAIIARSARRLTELAREFGPGALALPCDLTRPDSVAAMALAVREQWADGPDILVNNAGVFELAEVQETAPDVFRRAVDTNLVAPFLVVHTFLPAMRERGTGHVVTIGSIADRTVFPGNGAYAASKHGARALHEVLRAETRGTGVRATLVSPGPVDTELWTPIDPDSRSGFTPRAAMLTAAAVADAVCWALTRPAELNVDELRLSRA